MPHEPVQARAAAPCSFVGWEIRCSWPPCWRSPRRLCLTCFVRRHMTTHSKRVALAGALAPWTVVAVSAVWALWEFSSPARAALQGVRPWEFILLFSIYGVPTAYVSLVLFLPLYYLARHLGFASYATMVAAGLLTCLPAALFYGRPYYRLVHSLVFLLPFGAAVATGFLWIVRRGAEPGASPNGGPAERLGSSGVGGGPLIGALCR